MSLTSTVTLAQPLPSEGPVNVVEVPLNYFIPPEDGSKPWVNVNHDPASGQPRQNFVRHPYPRQIENMRGKEASATLDGAGFQFVHGEVKCTAFDDDKAIEDVYYKESEALIKEVTGASRVVLFDHSESDPSSLNVL